MISRTLLVTAAAAASVGIVSWLPYTTRSMRAEAGEPAPSAARAQREHVRARGRRDGGRKPDAEIHGPTLSPSDPSRVDLLDGACHASATSGAARGQAPVWGSGAA